MGSRRGLGAMHKSQVPGVDRRAVLAAPPYRLKTGCAATQLYPVQGHAM